MTVLSNLRATVRAHNEVIPDPEGSRKGEMCCKDSKLEPEQVEGEHGQPH